MFALKLKKRVSRFENHVDAAMGKVSFPSQVVGVFAHLHWNASCHLGSSLCMYNNYYFSNRFHVWLDMRRVCGSRKC